MAIHSQHLNWRPATRGVVVSLALVLAFGSVGFWQRDVIHTEYRLHQITWLQPGTTVEENRALIEAYAVSTGQPADAVVDQAYEELTNDADQAWASTRSVWRTYVKHIVLTIIHPQELTN